LPEDLTNSVNELSHRFAVTPFMTLLAAFQVLLYRYTGQEDVAVGSPIANRRRPELEGLIGFFVNTLVLRADLSGNPSFSDFLLQVRDTCVGGDANQDLPFEKLVQELQPERDQSRNPLFQVMFVLQNATRPFTGIPGLRIEPVEVATTRSPFDLSLFLRQREGKYIGYIEYSTDLFDRDRIERMAGHYRTLLEAIVSDTDQPVATLPILTQDEHNNILFEWNDTAADYAKDKCIHHLFEEQVERTPDAIALEFEEQQITYRELNRRANQLAHYLITLGIGPEKLVGICAERSIEMVVGLLGILKAGGAYVPLDPAYPKQRLRFMLEDSQVSVLLTQERFIEDRQWRMDDGDSRPSIFRPRLQIVCLDRDWPDVEQQSSKNPLPNIQSHNLAYVIYTSGSTGKPKGVQIEHRSEVNCLIAIGKQIELMPEDKWLAVTTISFDIAALELFLPLITGAKLVLANAEESGDATRLIARLETSRADVMQATPSMWQLLFDAGWQRPARLTILSGGEALPRRLADRFLDSTDSVWNLYGPTESTIWSTMVRITADENTVSIGRPVHNTQIYILDAHLQPLPIGIPGELYIGGDGLARGYLNRPELTAEKFIRNPFSHDPNSRLYRTGDLARYRADGCIEFLGRNDNQVKIRGNRIELGEIENVLDQHPSIKKAVVVARVRASSEGNELAAYVVAGHEPAPTVGELRLLLQGKLPQFMIPSVFVFLEALPLTANGKLDRDALPPPDGERPLLDQGFVEPRTEIEELVAQLWREVLQRNKIGIHDNFFDLGGHSLLALRALTGIQKIVSKSISIRDFFAMPTIATLAEKIARDIPNDTTNLPSIVRVHRKGPFPLSLAQKHVWELDQLFPGTLFLNMPYLYRLVGPLDLETLKRSLQEIVTRHEALRMLFKEQKGRPVQIIGAIPEVHIPIEDLRHLPTAEKEKEYIRVSNEDAELPFDLEKGPPFRVKLLRLTDNDHALLLTVHHIVCDHWSMRVFRRELLSIYQAFLHGQPSPLAEVPAQLVDYVSWQLNISRRGLLKAHSDYWTKQLADCQSMLEFCKDGKQRNHFGFVFKSEPIETGGMPFSALKACGRNEGCSTFMLYLAVISVVLYAATGQSDIRIGTTVANRGRTETDGLIANCLNVVVLRVKISPTLTFLDLLKQIKDTTLNALAHQELPFGQLAATLGKTAPGGKRFPLFQVMLVYQNRTVDPVRHSGLTFASWDGKYRRKDIGIALTPVELIFDLRELSTTLTGAVNYNTALFDHITVSRLIESFYEVVERVNHNSNRLISDLT
jgi:amino acid adenylation domain-containing protein